MADDTQNSLEPAILVIFGITGDLSKKYLMPSLLNLIDQGMLNEQTEILGVSRSDTTTDQLFEGLGLEGEATALDKIKQRTSMFKMDLENPADYESLLAKLNDLEEGKGICMNRLYYLSIPPKAYAPVVHLLGEKGLNASCQHGKAATRLLVEKPFGYDLQSAQELIEEMNQSFSEEQIFRIDHYMAKETVQNILTFRFKNSIFESLWNNQHVGGIEISAREQIGIAGRATFYEPLGALRDFIQSHLLQILGIVTMDQPEALDSQPIHAKKQEVLSQVQAVPADKVSQRAVRGQYQGYREEVDNPDSATETFAAIQVFIDNERWQGVPIQLVTGKALNERKTEVCITFKGGGGSEPNQLRFRIQPNEGIEVDLVTKRPGYNYETQKTVMNFSYKDDFAAGGQPSAYERVLVDAVRGDHTLFATSEEVLASWKIVEPVLEAWKQNADNLQIYDQGSAGPAV